MNKIFLVIFLITTSIPIKALETERYKFPVGFGTVSPMIDMSVSHDDNIYSQTDSGDVKGSWIGVLAPAVLWTANSGLNQYNVKYALESGTFFDSSDDNYLDHRFTANAKLDVSQRNRFDFELGYLKLHERRGTGLSDAGEGGDVRQEPDKYRDVLAKGKYIFGSKTAKGNIELTASFLDKKYTNNQLLTYYFDRKEISFGGAFIYRFRPNSSLFFETIYKQVDYDEAEVGKEILDNTENQYYIGLRWETTARTTGTAKIGYVKKEFDSAQYSSNSFVPWELGLSWAPRSYSIFRLSTASLSEETSGTGTFIHVQDYLLSWEHDWSDRFAHSLALGYTNDDYVQSLLNREDKTSRIKAGLKYLFRRSIVLGADYTFKDRNSNISGEDYVSNVFMLSAQIGM